MIKTVPMKAFASRIVSRLLATNMKLSEGKFNVALSELSLYFGSVLTSNILFIALLLRSSCRSDMLYSWQIFNNLMLESCLYFTYLLGTHDKQILVSICERYPNESREAFYSFLKVSSSFFLLSLPSRIVLFFIT